MPFAFTDESDSQMAASALRLYADDCRNLAVTLKGTPLCPVLADGAVQAGRLADQIARGIAEKPASTGGVGPTSDADWILPGRRKSSVAALIRPSQWHWPPVAAAPRTAPSAARPSAPAPVR
jgi:hypothetical protein